MPSHDRLHALDAVRAFALLLGVVFHAGFSFIPGMIPGLWAIVDNSPSTTLSTGLFAAHIFRMSLFFFVAGFFARLLYMRGGARGFWANRAKRILGPLVVHREVPPQRHRQPVHRLAFDCRLKPFALVHESVEIALSFYYITVSVAGGRQSSRWNPNTSRPPRPRT